VASRAHSQEPLAGDVDPSLPFKLPELNNTHQRVLPVEFKSKEQFKNLFCHGLKKFAITFVLVILFMVTIKEFSKDNAWSHNKKLVFNSVITGLSMALGMSVTEAFKCMAIDIRWWILSRKKRTLSEVCLPVIRLFRLVLP
jgi:hypothetical protein